MTDFREMSEGEAERVNLENFEQMRLKLARYREALEAIRDVALPDTPNPADAVRYRDEVRGIVLARLAQG